MKQWWHDTDFPLAHTNPALFEKFIARVGGGPCWEWTGWVAKNGYGYLWFGKKVGGVGSWACAHRVSYEFSKGPIRDGFDIDHLCRNTRCVRPDHLEAVPPRTNNLRGYSFAAVNARKTHCPWGHPYDGDNLIRWKGQRRCRACYNASQMRCYYKRMARKRAS